MPYTSSSLPFSGSTPISRHHSALAAEHASVHRGKHTRAYLALLTQVGESGVTDHQAAQMLGLPLSSICSIRNGCSDHVRPCAESALSPFGRRVTKWKRG